MALSIYNVFSQFRFIIDLEVFDVRIVNKERHDDIF